MCTCEIVTQQVCCSTKSVHLKCCVIVSGCTGVEGKHILYINYIYPILCTLSSRSVLHLSHSREWVVWFSPKGEAVKHILYWELYKDFVYSIVLLAVLCCEWNFCMYSVGKFCGFLCDWCVTLCSPWCVIDLFLLVSIDWLVGCFFLGSPEVSLGSFFAVFYLSLCCSQN